MNKHCCCYGKEKNVPRYWHQLSYAGETRVPAPEEPYASSWPTYFLKKTKDGLFLDCYGRPIAFKIRVPDVTVDFEGAQLDIVKKTLQNLTPEQKKIAKYWGTGPATKQWTPIIDLLIDTYKVTAPKAARILAATHAAINDAFIIAWHFKYTWNIARPNQLDQSLVTFLPTPNHPSYPSGHATVAGCVEVVLGYFFEAEKERLKELAEECAISRLYAGVHFPIDNDEGLRLGRQIGEIVVCHLDKQYDENQTHIDYPITEDKHAELPPPPYRQVIHPMYVNDYPDWHNCDSKKDFNKKDYEYPPCPCDCEGHWPCNCCNNCDNCTKTSCCNHPCNTKCDDKYEDKFEDKCDDEPKEHYHDIPEDECENDINEHYCDIPEEECENTDDEDYILDDKPCDDSNDEDDDFHDNW